MVTIMFWKRLKQKPIDEVIRERNNQILKQRERKTKMDISNEIVNILEEIIETTNEYDTFYNDYCLCPFCGIRNIPNKYDETKLSHGGYSKLKVSKTKFEIHYSDCLKIKTQKVLNEIKENGNENCDLYKERQPDIDYSNIVADCEGNGHYLCSYCIYKEHNDNIG